jgi:hypothetical protein
MDMENIHGQMEKFVKIFKRLRILEKWKIAWKRKNNL